MCLIIRVKMLRLAGRKLLCEHRQPVYKFFAFPFFPSFQLCTVDVSFGQFIYLRLGFGFRSIHFGDESFPPLLSMCPA